MKTDNPLSRDFLAHYPVEAARVLEQVSAEHVAALFTELPMQLVQTVIVAMLPEKAAASLEAMPESAVVDLVSDMPGVELARLFRRLTPGKQEQLMGQLPEKIRRRLRRYLDYPPASAGALLDAGIDMLPASMSVSEALRRIGRKEQSVSNEIYMIDDGHRLVGVINLGRLLTANRNADLHDIMNPKTQALSVHATAESLLLHPGWKKRQKLPVVERDNTLVGVLDINDLREAVDPGQATVSRDPMENLLSLASLYWLSVAQLLDGILSTAVRRKGD